MSTQSMFLSRNKKNNVYPCKPQFYYIKVEFKGGQNYIGMFFVMINVTVPLVSILKKNVLSHYFLSVFLI